MPYADPNNKPEETGPYAGVSNAATGPTSNYKSNRSRKAGEKVRKLQGRIDAAKAAGDKDLARKLRSKRENVEDRIYGDGSGNIADAFDAAAGGAGSKKGTARISRQDLRELEERYGKQAAVDFFENAGDNVNTSGGKAQKLLARYKAELTESPVDPDQPDPGKPEEGTTTPPEDTTTPPEDTTTTPPSEETTTTPPEGTGTGPDEDDNEQTPGTLTGGGIDASVGDNNRADDGAVIGGIGNVGGNNEQEGNANVVGSGTAISNETDNSVNDSFNGGTVGDINGNNNVVDNSNNSRYYGGQTNNMSIVYGEGSNPLNTAPVSDLTTLGLGKADDSPAAQMAYVDRYQTANADAQKKYEDVGSNTAYKYIANAAATNPIDYQKLNEQISGSIQNHYDNALLQSNYYMGDGYNYVPPTWNMPEPPKAIESDVADIAEQSNEELKEAVE